MSDEERGIAGSRPAALRETAVVVGLALGATWLVPFQTTSGPVLGLAPAFLPKLCTIAVMLLAVIGLAARLWRPEPLRPERTAPVWPAALVLCVAIAGVLALQFLGPFAAGLIVMALGLAALGERRIRVLLITLAGSALVFGVIYQVWR